MKLEKYHMKNIELTDVDDNVFVGILYFCDKEDYDVEKDGLEMAVNGEIIIFYQSEIKSIEIIQRSIKIKLEGYKNKLVDYYNVLRDEGQSLSVHAVSRLDRIEKKGFKIITINDVLDLSKRKPDFRQNDVKVVHFDERLQLAIIRNNNTNDIVSIVRRKHKKDGWYGI